MPPTFRQPESDLWKCNRLNLFPCATYLFNGHRCNLDDLFATLKDLNMDVGPDFKNKIAYLHCISESRLLVIIDTSGSKNEVDRNQDENSAKDRWLALDKPIE